MLIWQNLDVCLKPLMKKNTTCDSQPLSRTAASRLRKPHLWIQDGEIEPAVDGASPTTSPKLSDSIILICTCIYIYIPIIFYKDSSYSTNSILLIYSQDAGPFYLLFARLGRIWSDKIAGPGPKGPQGPNATSWRAERAHNAPWQWCFCSSELRVTGPSVTFTGGEMGIEWHNN